MEWVTHIIVFVLGAWFGIGVIAIMRIGSDE